MQNKAIILQDSSQIQEVYGKSKAIFINEEPFKKYIDVQEEGIPIIQISDQIFNQLVQNSDDVMVGIKYSLNKELIQVSNVVGKISGKNKENAIILSAHFDHVGYIGNKVFYGAVDNSSGVSVILNVARRLKEYSKTNRLDSDVLVCLFNGEESGLQGSKSFVQEIKGKYKSIYNINVDTVGIREDQNLLFVQGDGKQESRFIQVISDFFNTKGFNVQIDSAESDHISFLQENVPAVNLGQKSIESIHTIQDKPDNINYEYLEKLSDALYNLVIDKGNQFYAISESINEEKVEEVNIDKAAEVDELIENAMKELKFGQYKFLEIDGMRRRVEKSTIEFSNLDDIAKIYPELNILSNIGNYTFEEGCIIQNLKYVPYSDVEINKVYSTSPKVEDISYVSLVYKNKDQNKQFSITIKDVNEKKLFRDGEFDGEFRVEKMEFDDREYDVIYEDDNIISLKTTIEGKSNKTYQIEMSMGDEVVIELNNKKVEGIRHNWFDNSIQEIINFMKNNQVNNLIENIL